MSSLVGSPQNIYDSLGSQAVVTGTEVLPEMGAWVSKVSTTAGSTAGCEIRVLMELSMASTAAIYVFFARSRTRLDIKRLANLL